MGKDLLKFGISEKHTNFEKNLPHGVDKSADLLSTHQNREENFFKLRVLLKKSEFYLKPSQNKKSQKGCIIFNSFFTDGSWEKGIKNGAARKFFGPSYFVTALVNLGEQECWVDK